MNDRLPPFAKRRGAQDASLSSYLLTSLTINNCIHQINGCKTQIIHAFSFTPNQPPHPFKLISHNDHYHNKNHNHHSLSSSPLNLKLLLEPQWNTLEENYHSPSSLLLFVLLHLQLSFTLKELLYFLPPLFSNLHPVPEEVLLFWNPVSWWIMISNMLCYVKSF